MHVSHKITPVGPDPEAATAAQCVGLGAELVRAACAPDVSRHDEVLLSLSLALGFLEAALTAKDQTQRLWPSQLKVSLASAAESGDPSLAQCLPHAVRVIDC